MEHCCPAGFRRALDSSLVCIAVLVGMIGPSAVSAAVPAPLPPAGPQYTPYQQNNGFFRSWDDAIRALKSSDILMRRSAVEYLGRATETDGASGSMPYKTNRKTLVQDTSLVPFLVSALQELPEQDSRQAARLLSLYGIQAKSSIPAVCAILVGPDYAGRPGNDNLPAREDLVACLRCLCGEPNEFAPTLIGLLHASNVKTRQDVAAALPYCHDWMFLRMPSSLNGNSRPSPEKTVEWRISFVRQVGLALAGSLKDSDSEVSAKASQSLISLMKYQDETDWQPIVTEILGPTDSASHAFSLPELQVLAAIPADLSGCTRAIRSALNLSGEQRVFALVALSHATLANPERTAQSLLDDLSSAKPATRRRASKDLSASILILWGKPVGNSLTFWRIYPVKLSAHERDSLGSQFPAGFQKAQSNLLAALVRGSEDKDVQVRRNAALCLEQIGKWVSALLSDGVSVNEGERLLKPVTLALEKVTPLIATDDPGMAQRLQAVAADINRNDRSVF